MSSAFSLALKSYLRTARGKHGGLRLAREAGDISVGAVVRDMEQELGVLGCLRGEEGYCRIEECCVLRRALGEATKAFLAVLDRYTIMDLLEPRRSSRGFSGLAIWTNGGRRAPEADGMRQCDQIT